MIPTFLMKDGIWLSTLLSTSAVLEPTYVFGRFYFALMAGGLRLSFPSFTSTEVLGEVTSFRSFRVVSRVVSFEATFSDTVRAI